MNLPLDRAKNKKEVHAKLDLQTIQKSFLHHKTSELEGDEMTREFQFKQAECLEEVETAPDTESMISMREVLDAFDISCGSAGEAYPYERDSLWDAADDYEGLEQQIVQYIRENPGRSYNAIFNHFKNEGFTYTNILETYNTLVYSKKILLRVNVGTDTSPRYAHFAMEFFVLQPKRDVLYDILGPV